MNDAERADLAALPAIDSEELHEEERMGKQLTRDPMAPFRQIFSLRPATYHERALEAVEGLELDASRRVRLLDLLKYLKDGEDGPGWLLRWRRDHEREQTKKRNQLEKLQMLVAEDSVRHKDPAGLAYISSLRMRTPGKFHEGRGRSAQNIPEGCARLAVDKILAFSEKITREDARAIARGLGFRPSGR